MPRHDPALQLRRGPVTGRVAIPALVLLLTLALAAPVSAIINGTRDGNRHPNVAGFVSPTAYPDGTWVDCSGTLISPTIVLTAAHCREHRARVAVTFDPDYVAGDTLFHGRFEAHPLFRKRVSETHDIAVVVLDKPINTITPAALPPAGSLSRLPRNQPFTSVGYGAHRVTNGPGGHQYLFDDVRRMATGRLNAINATLLRVSMNVATGNGGTCYGDSGGPNFRGTTGVIAGITMTGDAVCRATNVVYRVDTASARTFLARYVAVP